MIGRIGKAYAEGRALARAGKFPPPLGSQRGNERARFLALGWLDERARMRAARTLPQLELQLAPVQNAVDEARPEV